MGLMFSRLTDQGRLERLATANPTQNLITTYLRDRSIGTDRRQEPNTDGPDPESQVKIDLGHAMMVRSSADCIL
jgi:hypothetical protein